MLALLLQPGSNLGILEKVEKEPYLGRHIARRRGAVGFLSVGKRCRRTEQKYGEKEKPSDFEGQAGTANRRTAPRALHAGNK